MNQSNPNNSNMNPPGSQAGESGSGFGNSQFGAWGGTQFNSQGGGGAGGGGGEFNTFANDTNAVSQIFKEGGFGDDDKKKRIIILGAAVAAAVVCLGAVWWLLFSDSGEQVAEDGEMVDELAASATPAPLLEATPAVGEEALAEDMAAEGEDVAELPEESAGAGATGTAQSGSSYTYNEEDGGPVVTVSGAGAIEVSRSSDFSNLYVTGMARDGKFRIPNPPPGTIYWRMQGGEATAITINPPPALSIQFSAPASISAGGQLSWSGSGPVSFYRVEFSTDQQFMNVSNVFTTSQSAVTVQEVGAGKYFVRVGGFNRAAGKMEFTAGYPVDVQ